MKNVGRDRDAFEFFVRKLAHTSHMHHVVLLALAWLRSLCERVSGRMCARARARVCVRVFVCI